MKTIDLSGEWRYETDESDCGIAERFYLRSLKHTGFRLPGTACENQIGRKQEYYAEFSKEAIRAPRERYEYIGPLWLQRSITVPKEFAGRWARLFMERVNLASDLWLDGEKIERQIIELSTPHIYRFAHGLTEGEHIITLRIDNRNLLHLNDMASGYSIDTQGYWNGVIGRLELQFEEPCFLEDIQVYPKQGGIDIRLTAVCPQYVPCQSKDATLEMMVITPEGGRLERKRIDTKLYCSHQVEYHSYAIDDVKWWDEFTPSLYQLEVELACDGVADRKCISFGMRTVCTESKKLLLNGRQAALRGTIDCAQYPITGYPPTDTEVYRKNFRMLKSYGLNHIRFHAWCPPEAAFVAADEEGLYLSVEMPMWLNRDIGDYELGDDVIHRAYFSQEALAISKTYGNHPSFLLFSNGNENMGDFGILDDITKQTKAYDMRRIYTVTSNFDHPVLPCEDYFCAFDAHGNRIRIQGLYDEVAKHTCNNYDKAVGELDVPIISFEVGQYCVYPDVDVIEAYTGNMLPVNFDVVKKKMLEAGVYGKRDEYIKASGRLALLLYKEDIESAMRTENFGGFELLSLTDYTGQSTATVGMLDILFREKGFTSAEEFRRFCNSTVPLFEADRIYEDADVIHAALALYDFGKERIEKPVFSLAVSHDGEVVYETETAESHVEIPLAGIQAPAMLDIGLSVREYTNHWNVFVFRREGEERTFRTVSNAAEIEELMESGGAAIITPERLKEPVDGNFIPVFWSPVHFPTEQGCGAVIDAEHAVFDKFPTGRYLDWQWKELLEHAKCADISSFGRQFTPLVEIVPNYAKNNQSSPLFELRAGKAKFLFCGFSLEREDAATRQFRQSVLSYVNSERFWPAQIVEGKKLSELFD